MIRLGYGPALAAALLAAAPAHAAEFPVGAVAPDFVLKSTSGENYRLSEYRGEVVILSFWAAWCGDCRAQLEALAQMQVRYQDTGIELLTVSLDQSRREAAEVTEAIGVTSPVLHDAGGEVGRLYAVERMPTMLLIDREGVVREVFEGFARGSEEQYLERVQALLRE